MGVGWGRAEWEARGVGVLYLSGLIFRSSLRMPNSLGGIFGGTYTMRTNIVIIHINKQRL